MVGDFDAGKFRSVLPNFYQHVKCATREKKTLDQLYSTHRETYKALPRPPFGKSDHNFILLIPAYIQKLEQEAPVTRSLVLPALVCACKQESGGWNYGQICQMEGEGELRMWSLGGLEFFSLWLHI